MLLAPITDLIERFNKHHRKFYQERIEYLQQKVFLQKQLNLLLKVISDDFYQKIKPGDDDIERTRQNQQIYLEKLKKQNYLIQNLDENQKQ